MRVAVLGAGVVGHTLAGKLRELGHDVSVGTRNPRDGALTYAEAAAHGELIVNATAGAASLEALDFGKGMPPGLTVANDDSVGEQIQRAHPEAKVVKALNTVNNEVMVDPSLVPGEHVLFVCGNDDGAKAQVVELLGSFGWPPERIVDLGDITNARGTEMYIALWIRLMGALGTPHFNITLARA